MVIHNYLRRLKDSQIQPSQFEILGTDISSEALSVAQLGAYDRFSVERGLDPSNQNLYFKQNQNFWIVDPMLKRIVTFKKFNLLDNFHPLGMFDAVFLRNVAIYFAFQTKIALVRKIRAMLPPGGLFFLGSTESLTFMPHDFESKDYQRHVYYQAPG
jgi:chemotaxis protein methyltransferase CheR